MSSMTVLRVGPRVVRRMGVVAGPVLIGALLLAACGSDSGSGASATTLDLSQSSTAFVVRPPVTTLAPTDSVAADGTTTGKQEYTIQAGDYPLKLTQQFGVTLEDLIGINEWASADEFPGIGSTILIPPGGTVVTTTVAAAAATGDTTAPGDTTDTGTETPADTIPDAGDNCAEGKYTIVEGDYEGKVATNFDVTVDALRAANSSTSGYSAFFAGLEIVIPAKADC